MGINKETREKREREIIIKGFHTKSTSKAYENTEEKVPKHLLNNKKYGEIPSDWSMKDYKNLIDKYKRQYGENFTSNLIWLKEYCTSDYEEILFDKFAL